VSKLTGGLGARPSLVAVMLLLEATSYLHTLEGMHLRQFLCLIFALSAAVCQTQRCIISVHVTYMRAHAHIKGEGGGEREILTSQCTVTSKGNSSLRAQ
jgi:hypothetical protein